jgi:hypothetical protein
MMTDRFHAYAQETLDSADSPAITAVEPGGDDGVPFGTLVLLHSGGQIHIQWVRSSSSGDRDADGKERIVTGQPPAKVEAPPLGREGNVSVADASRHIAALLNNGGNPELARVEAWADVDGVGSDRQPNGVRAVCHSGAMVFGLFRHTLRPGQGAAEAFRQKETI